MNRKIFTAAFLSLCLVILLLGLNGCIFAPSVASVNKAGFTEASRKETLNDAVKGFNVALFWENYPLASAYAAENNLETVKVLLQEKRNDGRIVESKVENISFYDDAYKAEVDVHHKIQDFATNIVKPQTEKQVWTFSVYDGWKLDSLIQNVT